MVFGPSIFGSHTISWQSAGHGVSAGATLHWPSAVHAEQFAPHSALAMSGSPAMQMPLMHAAHCPQHVPLMHACPTSPQLGPVVIGSLVIGSLVTGSVVCVVVVAVTSVAEVGSKVASVPGSVVASVVVPKVGSKVVLAVADTEVVGDVASPLELLVPPSSTHWPDWPPASSPYFLPDGHIRSGKLHRPAGSQVPGRSPF